MLANTKPFTYDIGSLCVLVGEEYFFNDQNKCNTEKEAVYHH